MSIETNEAMYSLHCNTCCEWIDTSNIVEIPIFAFKLGWTSLSPEKHICKSCIIKAINRAADKNELDRRYGKHWAKLVAFEKGYDEFENTTLTNPFEKHSSHADTIERRKAWDIGWKMRKAEERVQG